MKRWKASFSWTNWTFGIWWGQFHRGLIIGLDLGPLEVDWIAKAKK